LWFRSLRFVMVPEFRIKLISFHRFRLWNGKKQSVSESMCPSIRFHRVKFRSLHNIWSENFKSHNFCEFYFRNVPRELQRAVYLHIYQHLHSENNTNSRRLPQITVTGSSHIIFQLIHSPNLQRSTPYGLSNESSISYVSSWSSLLDKC
jgi:hypothetical protein